MTLLFSSFTFVYTQFQPNFSTVLSAFNIVIIMSFIMVFEAEQICCFRKTLNFVVAHVMIAAISVQ